MNDLKQLDLKVKSALTSDNTTSGGISSSTSNNNLAVDAAANQAATKASNENLFDEFRRRLAIIKKVNPIN